MITHYAFIFLSPEADPARDGVTIETGGSRNRILPVGNPSDAPDVARQAVADGAQLVELCGIFDAATVARVQEAVGAEIPLGVVRYPPEAIRPLAAAM